MTGLSTKLLSSASLLVSAKLIQRFIGLISILILARILGPEDFAVVAIISMVIYFFDVLSNVGNEQYIVQKADVSTADLNTAWTLSLLIKSILTVILVVLIPLIDNYYPQMDLLQILLLATLVLPINALKNPGIWKLQRELNYKPIFCLTIAQKIASFTAVMVVVYIEPSYWALVIGDVVGSITFLSGSYLLHPFRPKLTLQHGALQWIASRWILAKNIVGYTRSQVDTFLISVFFNAADLGRYYLSRDIVMLPSHNILTPAIQPLLAAFSKNQHSPKALASQMDLALLVTSLITVPIVMYVWWFPAPLIDTLLGDKWIESYLLLSVMSLLILYIPFLLLLEQALIAQGKFKQAFVFDLLSLIFVFSGLLIFRTTDLVEFALMRGELGLLATLALTVYVIRTTPFSIWSWLTGLTISFASAGIAAYLADKTLAWTEHYALLELLISGSVFVFCYGIILWVAMVVLAKKSANWQYINDLVYSRLQLIFKTTKKQLK
jgi:O-antigen/teichoic acid export membrane protein